MLSADQRTLLIECKEFMNAVHNNEWDGRPEWRSVLASRIDLAIAADAEQAEMIGGIRGALTRWLSKQKQP